MSGRGSRGAGFGATELDCERGTVVMMVLNRNARGSVDDEGLDVGLSA